MAYYEQTSGVGLGSRITPVVRNLLIANTGVWIIQQFADPFIIDLFALHPAAVINDLAVWQLFSYMFLHAGFFHLFFNMFSLWMFGTEIERTLGSRHFLRYYIITGLGGGFFQLLANWGDMVPILGASAAIYGILMAFAIMFPDRIITLLIFFVLPVQIKAKYLVAIFVGISLVLGFKSQLSGAGNDVAHFAHLGGAFVGLVLLRGRYYYESLIRHVAERQQKKHAAHEQRRQERIKIKQKEIDAILDRINEIGYENISQEEKNYLRAASEFLSKEDKPNS